MNPNSHLADRIYGQIGEELARNERSPGAAARAVSEAHGDRDLAESLYIKFRFEEIWRQLEVTRAAEEAARQAELQKQAALAAKNRKSGRYTCPHCGYHGKLNKRHRGSLLVAFLLLLVYIVPGIIYAMIYNGLKGVCPKCGKTVVEKL